MTAISFIFVDGWGIGADSPQSNPYFHAHTPFLDFITRGYGLRQPFPSIIHNHYAVIATDACLGVSGYPQSATGQTALMTGLNASLLAGRHISGYPTRQLQKLIDSSNIMKTSLESGFTTTLVNAYSPEYFEMIATGKRKHAAVAMTAIAAGIAFRSLQDLMNGDSIYQDLTNTMLQERGHPVSSFTPQQAGKIYAQILQKNDFTVFEYFQSDTVGHQQDMGSAVTIYERLDQFFTAIVDNMDLEKEVLIIASDHGNIEDVSTGTHTRNPVPTIVLGKMAIPYAHLIKDITDIAYLIRIIQNRS